MKFPAIIFDLDGTLLDTLQDIAFSMNAALAALRAPQHPAESYRRFVGQGLERLAWLVLPENRRDEATVRECVAAMRRVYAKRWSHDTKPYAGVTDMLAALKKMGVRCAVLSNKAHEFTVQIVAHFFGPDIFEAVLGGGTFPPKPDPAAALHLADIMAVPAREILHIGDSDIDMRTAANAGMHPAGVTWGFRSKEELLANGALLLFERPCEIIQELEKQV